MKIIENLPSCCKNCKRFVLKVDEQVLFIGKTRTRALCPRCKFRNVCDEYKREEALNVTDK